MTSAVPSERRADLDWIRVGAFFLLILYHVGMFYVPWDWHVKSPHPVEALEPVMRLTNPWRLTLLFLVSGAATRFMADKLTAGGLARARTARLLPPLILAMLVIVPPQTYYQVIEQFGFTGSVGRFYIEYLTAGGGWCNADGCVITPTWNHMWFVAYLFVYSLVLAALLAVARRPLERLGGLVESRLGGWGVIVWPLAAVTLLRFTLAPHFPVTHALFDDWYDHALSFPVFLLGFLTARSEPVKAAFIRLRWPALCLAVAGYAAYAGLSWVYRGEGAPAWSEPVRQAGYALEQWCAIAAVMGFGGRHLSRGGRVLDYLTLGVFPFYIVHQTIIVVVARNLAKAGLSQGIEAVVLIVATFCACFLAYEIIRRVTWLRPLFGLKPAPRHSPPERLRRISPV